MTIMILPLLRMRTKSLDDTSGLRPIGEALQRTGLGIGGRSGGSDDVDVDVAADSAFDYRFLDDARAALRHGDGGDFGLLDENDNDGGGSSFGMDQHHRRRVQQLLLASEGGALFGPLSRPEPPLGLIIHRLTTRNGLNVSWSIEANSSVPASFFIVEYRSRDSIGWQKEKPLFWSALTDRLVDRRWATIYDVRPAFRYDFRVFAFSAFNTFRLVFARASVFV